MKLKNMPLFLCDFCDKESNDRAAMQAHESTCRYREVDWKQSQSKIAKQVGISRQRVFRILKRRKAARHPNAVDKKQAA